MWEEQANKRFEYLDEYMGFDYVIDEYHTRDMSEFVVSRGGDVCTFRVYDRIDGGFDIYER